MKLKAQDLQTIVNATLEHYNRRAEGSGQAHAITMSLKKQQRQFSGALAGTAHDPHLGHAMFLSEVFPWQ